MILIDIAQARKNLKIDIMSESYPHLEGGAMADFKDIMRDREYWDENRWNETKHFYTFETGSVIRFISIDNLGKAHGPRRDILFLNECNNTPYAIYEQLEIRTKYVIWLDFNPVSEFWYNTEIKDRVDHDFIILTFLDNEQCPEAIRQSILSKQNNKNFWDVYGLGKWGMPEGKIYNGWQIIDDIPHEARLERYGLDFGYTNDPTAIVGIYYLNGGWILDEKCYKKGMSNKEIADTLKALPEKLVIADSAEPKSIDEIRSYGLNIQPCNKGKDSVRTGIQLVQDQPISVTKQSINLIKEYRNYLWMVDKNGKVLNEPEKGMDHALDAVRYALETLGRLKQETNYWDRIFADELGRTKHKFNKEC